MKYKLNCLKAGGKEEELEGLWLSDFHFQSQGILVSCSIKNSAPSLKYSSLSMPPFVFSCSTLRLILPPFPQFEIIKFIYYQSPRSIENWFDTSGVAMSCYPKI